MSNETRSPSYPQMNLGKALDLAAKLYKGIHRGSVGNAEAQQIMGYAPRSGSALAALSALKRFGLMEGRDPHIKLTELALQILEPSDARERADGIAQAATKPEMFAEVLESFGGRIPADSAIRAKLVRDRGFTSAGADAFIRSFKETFSFAEREASAFRIADEDITSASSEGEEEAYSKPQSSAPQHSTAQTAAATPGAGPISASQLQHLPGPGMQQAVFPLVEGPVYLNFPSDLTSDGYSELAEYLEIFLRRAARTKRVEEGKQNEG
ncbi:hypothetical protein D3C85_913130 [compost metagenome]